MRDEGRSCSSTDVETFEANRASLLAMAYRMLGDLARAEDVVQEAWFRWHGRSVEVLAPKAFLLKIVTRLCLNELDSARAQREESRGDRLPEPIDLNALGLAHLETLDEISMPFLVVLQRLTPAERAVLLLHDVFDWSHPEIARFLERTEAACRQLLSRAREDVAVERRVLRTSREDHRRLLRAFVRAASSGEADAMLALLADDAVLIVDGGPNGRSVGRIKNVGHPVSGARRVVALLAAVARESVGVTSAVREGILNGQPAIVMLKGGVPSAAILVSVADGRIRHVFVQADASRLTHLGPLMS
jgi:RNA polymerase sigma-70 factor (ECF subfamily)